MLGKGKALDLVNLWTRFPWSFMKCKSTDSDSIRQSFIDFFKEKGHEYCHSSSVVLPDDPTLLFVNAGMNQFKSIFTEQVNPTSKLARIKRAVNSQKCIRAGGKHNDLDDVGKDVYHHTFFEMLGNWSFGDYFKDQAIEFAWEFLTERIGLDSENLYATVFQGDENNSLPMDVETRNIWLKYLPENRVLNGSFKDNFWEMGDVGPCGPCTELHYDRIGGRDASLLVNTDDPNVLEIWNIVFIQFNREADGKLQLLPRKHVDTGMGLERLTSIVQNKLSNYDTDIFSPIFDDIQRLTGFNQAYEGKVGSNDHNQIDQAYRVVADHCRTLVIAISDGVYPNNTGRGYVVRRILRRAIRFSFEKLGASPGFMPQLIRPVAEILSRTFPEIQRHVNTVVNIVAEEETQFLKTMSRGRKYFEKATDGSAAGSLLSGEFVWKLYDTYGFPVDLTEIMCQERDMKIDFSGFEAAKLTAHKQSKQINPFSMSNGCQKSLFSQTFSHCVEILKAKNAPLTNDKFKYTCYKYEPAEQMYVFSTLECKVLAIIVGGKFVKKIDNDSCLLILDRTCFYSEGGGQVGDSGILTSGSSNFVVTDTLNCSGYVFHFSSITRGSLLVGDNLIAQVSSQSRSDTMKNHTATHILNLAFREQMGSFAEQKGSLVSPERLRFDVSYQKSITLDDIIAIEKISDALLVPDVRTLADEQYPEQVRVVHLGNPDLRKINSKTVYQHYSIELCGGTHLERTSHCGPMCIISSEPIAKGIRRFTAITGQSAKQAFEMSQNFQNELSLLIKEVDESHEDENKVFLLDRQIESFKKHMNAAKLKINEQIKKISVESTKKIVCAIQNELECRKQVEDPTGAVKAFVGLVDLKNDKRSLSNVISILKSDCSSIPLMLFSIAPDSNKSKIICQVHVPKIISHNLKANEWISQVGSVLNAKSGGSATSAQLSSDGKIDSVEDIMNTAQAFAALKLLCSSDSIIVFNKEAMNTKNNNVCE
ncbi:hypothetical protein GJ496_011751 [Pomphorhynchus laevis]|nr:hypothetical protein GJ496_011751 [Pomphorhynchus laevis]